MNLLERVYVPSTVSSDGSVTSHGCFSTQHTAIEVLKNLLSQAQQQELTRASILTWDIDVVGSEGMNVIAEFECKMCPVCMRTTFWIDLERFKAHCYGSACQAWIEENSIQPDVIDCGWPPTG